jgi:transposase InsO family protein
MLLAACVLLLLRLVAVLTSSQQRGCRRTLGRDPRHPRHPAKPAWVRREIVRLKALMREDGTCRAIADVFNRRFAATKRMTVGKTFVAGAIRKHQHEILAMRREIRNARPRRVPRNSVWAADLTGKTTLDARTQAVLGILEHASRAALWLEALPAKSSWALVARLCRAIRRHGRPQILRTDNEAVFTSRTFRLGLLLLGIRHQRIDPHCPWQNGRVERFFGTLKCKLDRLAVHAVGDLNRALVEFRFFYNHVRPHQNLGGATPAEAWSGIDLRTHAPKGEYWRGLGRTAEGLLLAAMKRTRCVRMEETAAPGPCPADARAERS